MFVNTLREMISIELGKEIEKDVFRLVTSVWRNKKILSPHEESNLRPSDSALRCSTTEPQRPSGERGLLETKKYSLLFCNMFSHSLNRCLELWQKK